MFSALLKRELDVDDPRTTAMWRGLVLRKRFLHLVYEEWYAAITSALPGGAGAVLELGSGAGFLVERVPDVIASDIMACPGVRVVLDAQRLPFGDRALRAIVMTDVIHHLPDVEAFFHEAARCVRQGGVIAMVEPWLTDWSRFVYHYLHPEPMLPEAKTWAFESSGPLSGANSALPWIMFERDRALFAARFPQWRIQVLRLEMPFRYLLSGGLSPITVMPGHSFELWRGFEERLRPWMDRLAMFAFIVLERTSIDGASD